ncbi:hypothetical protein GGR57DRAFT_465333 [Xylariaceae sp. FL1272]|nr:hypothetical protein GGR57DRAFT_465333 [Xylariaceae sp. FL1272]
MKNVTKPANETLSERGAPWAGRSCEQTHCPYTTASGNVYRVYCRGYFETANAALTSTPMATYTDCVDHCGATEGCAGVNYKLDEGLCLPFTSAHGGFVDVAGFNVAYSRPALAEAEIGSVECNPVLLGM